MTETEFEFEGEPQELMFAAMMLQMTYRHVEAIHFDDEAPNVPMLPGMVPGMMPMLPAQQHPRMLNGQKKELNQ